MGSEESDTADRRALLAGRLREELGSVPETFDASAIPADVLEDYIDLLGHPRREGPLEAKTEELVLVAVTAATTHLYADGLRRHVGNALDEGASVEELVEVLTITAQLGNHSVTDGVSVLAEETDPPTLDDRERERQDALAEQFERETDYWAGLAGPMRDLLAFDPTFFDHMTSLTHDLYREGALDRKTKEFISIAIDASTTHLYAKGTRTHVRNALDAGATAAEIMAVLELTAVIGMHTLYEGVPVVLSEAAERADGADEDP